MKNIIYFCPRMNTPIGGIKVIHRHSELINSLGGKSEIYYCRPFEDDRVDWFKHEAFVRQDDNFDSANDFVIFPESTIFDAWKLVSRKNVEFGIFVQNGYLLSSNLAKEDIAECYERAKYIFCISEDAIRCIFRFFPEHANKVVRVTYSIDDEMFRPGAKENIITYMPRKMNTHSELFLPMLRRRVPDNWRIVEIDKMSEDQVASALARSRIFLAFSSFEGLPVPPVEAALSGNFVIGHTGQGGKEYWSAPVFEEIESGDLVGLTEAALDKISDIEKYGMCVTENHTVMLREMFSREMERKLLKKMIDRINA